MEKQIKVIICADDGEWSRENTDALASRGAQVVTVTRNGKYGMKNRMWS